MLFTFSSRLGNTKSILGNTGNMPNRCVVGGCSNAPDISKGIVLHKIPFAGDDRPQAKKRRQQWIDFVKTKWAKWEPTKNSCICSVHFKLQDFLRMFAVAPVQTERYMPRLVSDDIGIAAIPLITCSCWHKATFRQRTP